MIRFLNIEIEGFGSIIKPLKYKLNKPGLNMIMGVNGVGKTTIFSAMSWCIWGKLLKKDSNIEPWPEIIDKNFMGTKVCVSFFKNKKYRIIKCRNYKGNIEGEKGKNRLILYEGEKPRLDLRNNDDVQKEIINILGYTFELFKNSIIFGQKMKRLIEENNPDQKKIFEEAFEIEYLSKAKKNAETLKEYYKEKKYKVEPQYKEIGIKITIKEEQLETENERFKNFDDNRNIKIKKYEDLLEMCRQAEIKTNSLTDTIKQIDENLSQLHNDVAKLKELENKQFKVDFSMVNKNGDIGNYKMELENLKEKLGKIPRKCSRCNRSFSKQQIKEELDRIKFDIKKCKSNIEYHTGELGNLKKDKESLDRDISSLKIINDKINSLNYKKKKLEDNLKVYSGSIKMVDEYKKILEEVKLEKLENKIEELKQELNDLNKQFIPLKKELRRIDKKLLIAEWLIKEPLSNSGIKAYIFDQMLSIVNQKLRKYSDYLGYRIKFGIDMDSYNKGFYTTIYKNNSIYPYEDQSGGQQQLINICVTFAIHDAITINKDCNILVMDEVFENLSSDNIEKVTELIQLKSFDKAIHIITHRSEFNYSNANTLILNLNEYGQTVIQ